VDSAIDLQRGAGSGRGERTREIQDRPRDLIRRDQMQAEEQEALIAALVTGEKSGISKRRIPEILAAVKQELNRHGG